MSFQVSRKISLLSLLKNFFRVCRHLPKIYLANYIFEQFTFSSCVLWSPSNWHYQKRKNLNIFRPKEKNFSDAVKDVFDSRLVANCTFFFMAFLDSFFPITGSDMDDAFCPSTSFIIVAVVFKYSFTFWSKKMVQFKLHKIISDTNVTVNCDSPAIIYEWKRTLQLHN